MIVNGFINKKMILIIKILNCCVKFLFFLFESYGYFVYYNIDYKLEIVFIFFICRD